MLFWLFPIGYIAGLSIVFIPLPYMFVLAITHDCSLYELFFDSVKGGMGLLPLHLGVLCGIWTNVRLIKKYNSRALILPLGLLIGIPLLWAFIHRLIGFYYYG